MVLLNGFGCRPNKYKIHGISIMRATRVLLLFTLIVSAVYLAEKLWGGVSLDCKTRYSFYVLNDQGYDEQANEHCWENGLYVNERGFANKAAVHPGVIADLPGDKIRKLGYYTSQLFIIGISLVLFVCPYWILKTSGVRVVEKILVVDETSYQGFSEQILVSNFLKVNRTHKALALVVRYIVTELVATLLCLIQFLFVSEQIGDGFLTYGIDWISPKGKVNPMERLFPMYAKCYDRPVSGDIVTGDEDRKSALCSLPLNKYFRYAYFLYYWISLVCLFVALVSLLRYIFYLMFKRARNYSIRRQAYQLCYDDVEAARRHVIKNEGCAPEIIRSKRSKVITVHIEFSTFLTLGLMKRNLTRNEYRDFLNKLLVTKNNIIQVHPKTTVRECRVVPIEDSNRELSGVVSVRELASSPAMSRYIFAETSVVISNPVDLRNSNEVEESMV